MLAAHGRFRRLTSRTDRLLDRLPLRRRLRVGDTG
jgi:hypothetical protein